MVATLAGSVKKTMNNKKHASSTGFKNSVTKHSVINRIDLSKFQTVSWRFTGSFLLQGNGTGGGMADLATTVGGVWIVHVSSAKVFLRPM